MWSGREQDRRGWHLIMEASASQNLYIRWIPALKINSFTPTLVVVKPRTSKTGLHKCDPSQEIQDKLIQVIIEKMIRNDRFSLESYGRYITSKFSGPRSSRLSGHFHFGSLVQCPDEIWYNSVGIPNNEPLPAYSPRTSLSSGSVTFGLNITMQWKQ
jgi:hypothetical protein